jgi:hypothetical protein
MQQVAQQGQVEGLITDWCATNGFGSDPVTISTFTELAAKLLSALPEGVSQREDMPLLRPDVLLADEDLLTDTATDESATNNLLSPYIRGEGSGIQDTMVLQNTLSENKTAGKANGSSLLTRLFREASGDWRAVCHDDKWWVVGHHLAYPAKDRDHAERRRQELSKEYLQS